MPGIVIGQMNKKTLCPSCVLQRKAAMETKLLYSVTDPNTELSTQFDAAQKRENLIWQGIFLCRENKI